MKHQKVLSFAVVLDGAGYLLFAYPAAKSEGFEVTS